MSWEWEHHTNPQRWTLDIGEWHAVVQRANGPRYQWQAFVESTNPPYKRYVGPIDINAISGRTWCLMKITELRRWKL